MNMIVLTQYAGRNEISQMGAVSNWLITKSNSSPALGQVDDSIIMLADLTRTGVVYDRYHASQLFAYTTIKPDLSHVGPEGITGREIVSMTLERTPINLNRDTTWYNPAYAPYISYNPEDTKLVILKGKIISGVLDKKNIGAGAVGGLYHVIANEYGSDTALEVMFNMQQLAIAHTYLAGYTIGVKDFIIDEASKAEIDRIASDLIKKSSLITSRLIAGEIIPPIGQTVNQYYESLQINTLSIFDDFLPTVLKAISPEDNNLFRMIAHGSKGSIDNLFNMVSGAGQKLINGSRIKENYGHKRVLKYFKRFGTERGYIANSYLNGMTTTDYIFNAMASRFDLISKALSTSITGQQNREGIKSLESAFVNNWRMTTKRNAVVQFAYGEDFLDPRKLESVKFPTAFISNKKFEDFLHQKFASFNDAMAADRKWYRDCFLKLEKTKFKERASDSRLMPFNMQRIIDDVCMSYPDRKDVVDGSTEHKDTVKFVEDIINRLPYLLMNEIQETYRVPIPLHMATATKLPRMYIRSYLNPVSILRYKIDLDLATQILDRVRNQYKSSLVDPGTAAGILAAQGFSEPFTQYMLDAHHRSASGGTSNNSMVTSKEILGAKPVEKLLSPSMLLPVNDSIKYNKQRVQELANNIEVMKLEQFVLSWQIFYEKYGAPVYPKYIHETKLIAEFAKHNPLLTPPGDLTRWCLRLTLNKSALILKNMSIELIVSKLRRVYQDTHIVYTNENSPEALVRVYFRSAMFKAGVTLNIMQDLREVIFGTTIRGIEGIISTRVVPMMRSRIDEEGAVVNDDAFAIATVGTNITGVLHLRDINRDEVLTSAIQEVSSEFGIMAARQSIRNELHSLLDKCSYRHNSVYSDDMTFTGRITAIGLSGVKSRESQNILLRVGFSSPLAALEEAAIHEIEDTVSGVTGNLLVGTVPQVGTTYNAFYIDEEFVQANVKKTSELLEGLA